MGLADVLLAHVIDERRGGPAGGRAFRRGPDGAVDAGTHQPLPVGTRPDRAQFLHTAEITIIRNSWDYAV